MSGEVCPRSLALLEKSQSLVHQDPGPQGKRLQTSITKTETHIYPGSLLPPLLLHPSRGSGGLNCKKGYRIWKTLGLVLDCVHPQSPL